MDYSHHSYIAGETIAAIATPPGEGGVAIIRISGNNAIEVAQKVFNRPIKNFKTHTVHFGKIIDCEGSFVDEVLLIPLLGKKSFTGEDTIEIHCHGGRLITRRVLDVVLKAGARMAFPGEFSFKAFINGKIDLTQAEAIQELISAKNEYALNAAEEQLQGKLSEKILYFQKELTDAAAILEAWIDFPEEGLEFITMEELILQLQSVLQSMHSLSHTFNDGRIIHDGISLCLAGCPNVGKSSLLNALLDKNRAIVSAIPGTTRDIVEDHINYKGLNFKLIDTAGIRETDEEIEAEGIKKSHEVMEEVDLVLLLLDASKNFGNEEAKLLNLVPKEKTIVVWNKIDLDSCSFPEIPLKHAVKISAKNKINIHLLYEKIEEVLWNNAPPSKDEVIITNVRHEESLNLSIESLKKVIIGLKEGLSPEFLILDLRQALFELGKIIGTNIGEDILTAIFSKFCIGK